MEKVRVVIDFPVEDDGDTIRIGRFIFRKCDECPLSDEEIAVMLIVNGLTLGFENNFDIVGFVGGDIDVNQD